MACRFTIDLSPPLSPALLPPEVYAELYKSYVSTYRALGFALMGRTNAPKSQPATPPPKDKAARPPKPVAAPVPDPVRSSSGLAKASPAGHTVISYAAAAAAARPPSPPPSSPPDTALSRRSVKVTSDPKPKPKPNRETPTRSKAQAAPKAASVSGSSTAFDAEMSDVDSAPTLVTQVKDPSRDPRIPAHIQVTQVSGPYPPRMPMRGCEHMLVYRIDNPELTPLIKELEDGAVHEDGFTFPSKAEERLTEVYKKLVGDVRIPDLVYVLPASAAAKKRMENTSGKLVTSSWHTLRSRQRENDCFWFDQNDQVVNYRLLDEYVLY